MLSIFIMISPPTILLSTSFSVPLLMRTYPLWMSHLQNTLLFRVSILYVTVSVSLSSVSRNANEGDAITTMSKKTSCKFRIIMQILFVETLFNSCRDCPRDLVVFHHFFNVLRNMQCAFKIRIFHSCAVKSTSFQICSGKVSSLEVRSLKVGIFHLFSPLFKKFIFFVLKPA